MHKKRKVDHGFAGMTISAAHIADHPQIRGGPVLRPFWIPVFTGMTTCLDKASVIPEPSQRRRYPESRRSLKPTRRGLARLCHSTQRTQRPRLRCALPRHHRERHREDWVRRGDAPGSLFSSLSLGVLTVLCVKGRRTTKPNLYEEGNGQLPTIGIVETTIALRHGTMADLSD